VDATQAAYEVGELCLEDYDPQRSSFFYSKVESAKKRIREMGRNPILSEEAKFLVELISKGIDLCQKGWKALDKEHRILEKLTSDLPEGCIIYTEGREKGSGPEIGLLQIAKRKGAKVEFLDEGNEKFEKYMDALYSEKDDEEQFKVPISEVLRNREDYWVEKIERSMEEGKCAIVIVGEGHIKYSLPFIQKLRRGIEESYSFLKKALKYGLRNSLNAQRRYKEEFRNWGYFGEKLKERGYKIEIIDI
jgi:hypothetical protein